MCTFLLIGRSATVPRRTRSAPDSFEALVRANHLRDDAERQARRAHAVRGASASVLMGGPARSLPAERQR